MSKLIPVPIDDRIIVKQRAAAEITAGGILIPKAAHEKPTEGVVIAVSEENEVDIKIGDTVIYTEYGPSEIELDGEKYLIVTRSDILCILREEK